jgi:nucleoside phosphorylase
MKILILEDEPNKASEVCAEIRSADDSVFIHCVSNFREYLAEIIKKSYDLVIVDLMVLDFPSGGQVRDMTDQIIEVTRDFECPNYKTPVLAITRYDSKAEEKFKDLNGKDINVITFDTEGRWKIALKQKINSCKPPVSYDFVIVCALEKEADAFRQAGYAVDGAKVIKGLLCREISISGKLGTIITAPRMGLVSSAIVCTQAIDHFSPKLICMSGICAGVHGRAQIYDIVIPEICHQNDSGKWTKDGFVHEGYSVQIDHGLRQNLSELISRQEFKEKVREGITLKKAEFPEGVDELQFDIFLAPTSSGSAVVADENTVGAISGQHRKLSAFEMESFSLYEAARLSPSRPKYFSAKAVVDDGTPSKGDAFHRVAALLSARVVHECLEQSLLRNL